MRLVNTVKAAPKAKLELGDVLVSKGGSSFIVIEVYLKGNTGFVAKSFCGTTGYFGMHDSLQELNDAYVSRGLPDRTTVYKAKEFELHLAKR